jgi:hypothetical protein
LSGRRLLLFLALYPGWAAASHPLLTEDTGVLGKGGSQIELHGERIRDQGARDTESFLTLSHGVAGAADFQVELPLNQGDALLSLKWRMLEGKGLSLALKPDLYEGGSWAVNLAAGYALGRLEILGHAAYLHNRLPGERESLRHASLAALLAATDKLKLVLDVSRDTDPDPAGRASVRERVLGATYALSDDIDIGLGVKSGLSDPADDRSLRAGIKIRW